MKKVIIYSADWCPYCQKAKQLLDSKGVNYKEFNVDTEPHLRDEIVARTGMKTIPQIFIEDQFVGGYSELSKLESEGSLDKMLKEA